MCESFPAAGIGPWAKRIVHHIPKREPRYAKVAGSGMDAYRKELKRKISILEYLIETSSDGRKRVFNCVAANVLELRGI